MNERSSNTPPPCRSGSARPRSGSRRCGASARRVAARRPARRPRDGAHALLHLADVVENADRGPHHPARHGDDAHASPSRWRCRRASAQAVLHSQTEARRSRRPAMLLLERDTRFSQVMSRVWRLEVVEMAALARRARARPRARDARTASRSGCWRRLSTMRPVSIGARDAPAPRSGDGCAAP